MFDAASVSSAQVSEDDIILERSCDDHLAPDHYWSFQTILITDSGNRRRLAWRRRWGGPRHARLSEIGRQLVRDGRIDAVFVTT